MSRHAQNGFFYAVERVPVVASAYAIGFLQMAFYQPVSTGFLSACLWVLELQGLVGVVGMILHLELTVMGASTGWLQKIVEGPPVMAPLLFPNLAILSGLGILDWRIKFGVRPGRR